MIRLYFIFCFFAPRYLFFEVSDLPDTFDWRDKNVVSSVKDQGTVGTCWAFSTVGNVEGQWALAGHPVISLATEQLVDCDATTDPNKCELCKNCNYSAKLSLSLSMHTHAHTHTHMHNTHTHTHTHTHTYCNQFEFRLWCIWWVALFGISVHQQCSM